MTSSSSTNLSGIEPTAEFVASLPNSQYIDPRAGTLFASAPPVCNYGPFLMDEVVDERFVFTQMGIKKGTREFVAP